MTKEKRKQLIGGFDGCRGDGVRLSFVVLVSEKPNLVSEKSGKSQGILFICGAGNPVDRSITLAINLNNIRHHIWQLMVIVKEKSKKTGETPLLITVIVIVLLLWWMLYNNSRAWCKTNLPLPNITLPQICPLHARVVIVVLLL